MVATVTGFLVVATARLLGEHAAAIASLGAVHAARPLTPVRPFFDAAAATFFTVCQRKKKLISKLLTE